MAENTDLAAANAGFDGLAERVERVLPKTLEDLKAFVAIPSISAQPEHAEDVQRAAEQLVEWLAEVGCPEVKIVREGGQPAVIGRFIVDESLPTVCLYSHFDVQPTGDLSQWNSEPFVATERDGRLYGRGPADDKGGIAVHLAALRAFDGRPPVNVICLFEGEEEMGSPTLANILATHRDELAADVYVIADCGNWQVGTPAFTSTLRGVVDCKVKVSTLDHGLHSGEYGGPLPDALTTLCRLLATLHDEQGNVAVQGLVSSDDVDVDYSEQRLREESGVLDGVELIGSGPIGARTWTKPAISVIGLDTTSIANSANLLIPSAEARISLRIAPGDSVENAWNCLKTHLESHVPWGAHLELSNGEGAAPSVLHTEGEMFDVAKAAFGKAFGVEPVLTGTGGTIGMIAEFQKTFPETFVLGCGVADPGSRMHGIDESLSLADWRKVCLAESYLLQELATVR